VVGAREPAAVLPAPRIEPALELPPRPASAPAPPMRNYRRRRFSAKWVALIVLVVVLAIAISIGITTRGRVAANWPLAVRLYGLIGLPVDGTGAGLDLGKVTPTRTPDGLIIEGDIVNNTGTARDIPRLRVALRDSSEKEVQFKIIEPPKPQLAPGEVAHFKTPFEHPEENAAGVVVTFAAR
jgi:hypothetical protein